MPGDPIIRFAQRMEQLPPYLFGMINKMRMEKRAQGHDVIDLGMGNPIDPAPDAVTQKLCEVVQDPKSHRYPVASGLRSLRREIAQFYGRDYDVELDVETEVLCTLTSRNIDHYMDVLEYCRSVGIVCNFNLFKPFRIEHAFLLPEPERFFDALIDLFDLRDKKGYQLGLANAAIASRLLGVKPQNECRATQSGLVINYAGQMVTCPSLEEAGRYAPNELPVFDNNWLQKWRTHPAFVDFKESGLANCQAREFVFRKLFDRADPYSADEFEKYLAKRST